MMKPRNPNTLSVSALAPPDEEESPFEAFFPHPPITTTATTPSSTPTKDISISVNYAGQTLNIKKSSLEDGNILKQFRLNKEQIAYWYLVGEPGQVLFSLEELEEGKLYTLQVAFKRVAPSTPSLSSPKGLQDPKQQLTSPPSIVSPENTSYKEDFFSHWKPEPASQKNNFSLQPDFKPKETVNSWIPPSFRVSNSSPKVPANGSDSWASNSVKPPNGYTFVLGEEFPSVVVKNQLFKPNPSIILANEHDGKTATTPPEIEMFFVNVSLVSSRDQKRTFQLTGNGRVSFNECKAVFKNLRTSALSSKYGDCKFLLKFEIAREDSPLSPHIMMSPSFQIVAKIPKDSKLLLERLIPTTVPSNLSIEVSLLGFYPISTTAAFEVIIYTDDNLDNCLNIRCERAGRGLYFKSPVLTLAEAKKFPVYLSFNGMTSPKPRYLTFIPVPLPTDELCKYWAPDNTKDDWKDEEED